MSASAAQPPGDRRRRRRRRAAWVGGPAAALVVAAAVVVLAVQPPGRGARSVTASRPGPAGRPGHGGPGAGAPPATRHPAVRAATLREVRVGGERRCLVVSDPVMAAAGRSPSRRVPPGAVAASAVWLPATPGRSGCRSTVTSAGPAGAAAVVGLLRRAGPLSQVTGCLSGATGGGMVDLVLHYPGGRRPAVLRAVLGPCGFLVWPDGHRRALPASTPAALAPLHPPAWTATPGSPPAGAGRPARLPERAATGRAAGPGATGRRP